jgi:hypothetical protein
MRVVPKRYGVLRRDRGVASTHSAGRPETSSRSRFNVSRDPQNVRKSRCAARKPGIPRTQRRSLGPSSPAQRSAATQRGRRVQQHRAHHSGKDQSRFPLGILFSEGSGSRAKNSPRVPRRSNSRLRRREASLLVLSKKESSFAIVGISFCVSNHSSSSLSAGMSSGAAKKEGSPNQGWGRYLGQRPLPTWTIS